MGPAILQNKGKLMAPKRLLLKSYVIDEDGEWNIERGKNGQGIVNNAFIPVIECCGCESSLASGPTEFINSNEPKVFPNRL